MGKLQAATAAVPTGSFADLVLRAVQATFTDAAQARTPLAGRKLFDLLDRSCGGQLAAWLGAPLAEPGGDGPAPLAGWARYL